MAVARPPRLRALLFVFAAAMIAAGTGYAVYQIDRDDERALDAARAEIATHQVVVATVDIVAGQEIGPDQGAEVERPGAEDDPRAIVRLEQVLGRMAGERIRGAVGEGGGGPDGSPQIPGLARLTCVGVAPGSPSFARIATVPRFPSGGRP